LTSIPGLWAFMISSLLMIALWLFSFQYLKESIGKAFFVLITSALLWSLNYIGELVSTDYVIKFLFVRLQFLGINTLPLAWLLLASLHTKTKVSPIIWIISGCIWIILFIFIFIMPIPNIFWGEPTSHYFSDSSPSYVLDYHYGPIFYFLLIPFANIIVIFTLVLLVKGLSKGHRFYRKQLNFVIAGIIIPATINILYVIGITPIPYMNFATAGMSLSGLLVGFALFRYRFLSISPIARELIIDTMLDGIVVVNENLHVVDINVATKEMFDAHSIELGCKLVDFIPSEIMAHIEVLIKKKNSESRLITFNDNVFDLHVTPLFDYRSKHNGNLIMFHDVTEREKLHHQVRQGAKLDSLTQILNRKALFEEIEKERVRILHTKGCLSLIMMDIDYFKQVNDSYGHEGGDRAIEMLVDVINNTLNGQHIFGRYGGDEFVIALTDTSFEKTLGIARLIHTRLTRTSIVSAKASFLIQTSLGVVTIGGDDNFPVPSSSDEIVSLADSALYKAKDSGRNTVAFVHPTFGKKIDPQHMSEGLK